MKRLLALILTLSMLLSLLPTVGTAKEAEKDQGQILTEADYRSADLMWAAVNEKETQLQSLRAPATDTTEALIQTVLTSPYYEEGSLIRNGEFFSWRTVDGIACGYSPRLRKIAENVQPLESYDPTTQETVIQYDYSTRSGSPKSRDVYLIQPYYGLDDDFTEQYVNEAKAVASALGGKSTVYRTTSATIDMVADAVEQGAVVFFDSHGDTDYASGEDYTTRANTSYLCLQTGTGLTTKDYEAVSGPYSTYYHAYYYGANGSMRFYCVDGTAIANHMDQQAQCSLLWTAICLGMATNGMHAPLRAKGVEVAYGYSQSVTFDYDYLWEESFWDEMLQGSTVSEAITEMKESVGPWDWCHSSSYDTIAEAREKYCAFPIVVSSEDVYPGHGNVDDLQAVDSTWTLLQACAHPSSTYHSAVSPTCTEAGYMAYYTCDQCNGLFTDKDCTNRTSLGNLLVSSLGHDYDEGVQTVAVTCVQNGVLTYTCNRCKHSYTETVLAMGHEYENGKCLNCGQDMPSYVEFYPGVSGDFIIAAKVGDAYYAMSSAFTTTSGKLSGTEIKLTEAFIPEELASDYVLTLTYDRSKGTYTIENNGLYLKYPSGSNLSASTSTYEWIISTGTKGSWRITSQTNTRALIYRARGYNVFGGYYTPNVTASGTEYYDVEIIPIGTSYIGSACTHDNTLTDTVPPSCETSGTLTVSCADCGEILSTEGIPALGHSFVHGNCSMCGLPFDEDPVLDSSIVIQHSLNLASDISINYAVPAHLLNSYDSFYLECVIPEYEGNTQIGSSSVCLDPIPRGDYYFFTLTGITAVQMGDELSAILRMETEEEAYYSEEDLYSVAAYAYAQLDKASASDSLKKLCAELLRYGSQAQIFKEYRTDALADAKLTEDQRTYLGELSSVSFQQINREFEDLSTPHVTWVGKTLSLESKVVVKFVFDASLYQGDISALTLHVSYRDYAGELTEAILTAPQIYDGNKGYYSFSLDSLLSADLRCVITATVYEGDKQISSTVEYSPDSYGNGKTGSLLELCRALFAYSDSAKAYFAN